MEGKPITTPTTRVFLVTGATGAIGQAIAHQLAQSPDHRGVLLAHNEATAQAAVDSIRRATANPHLSYNLADGSRRAEIEALAQGWSGPLHVLVNNAAITPRQRQETPEGIELGDPRVYHCTQSVSLCPKQPRQRPPLNRLAPYEYLSESKPLNLSY